MAYLSVPTDRYVPSTALTFVTGTWTQTVTGDLFFALKTAGAETSTVVLPIGQTRRSGFNGISLNSITWLYRATTADFSSAPTATIHRTDSSVVLPAAGVDLTATAIAQTTTGLVTAAATDRRLVTTVTTPTADGVNNGVYYLARLTLPCAAGTVVRVYGAIVNVTELT